MSGKVIFSGLFPLLLLSTIILSTQLPASAAVNYGPGVFPGSWAKYAQVSATWTSSNPGEPAPSPIGDLLGASSLRTNVSTVFGQEITAKQNRVYTNGTSRQVTLAGNVLTGEGNLTFWIISGGLSQGDRVFDNQTAPIINATINRVYLGSARTVNVFNITRSISFQGAALFVSAVAYWDRPTGVLMEIHFTENFSSAFSFSSGSGSATITETNLWGVQADFALYTQPIKTLEPGSSVQSEISVRSLNGFTGDVTLTAFVSYQGGVNGLTANLDRSVLKLTPDVSNSSIMTVAAASNTLAGYYNINLTATSDIGVNHYDHYLLVAVQVNSTPIPGTYVPGVEPADAVWYGTVRTRWITSIPISKPPFIADFENVSSINLEVRTVSGTTVTAAQTFALTNNTSRTVTISGDVNSGAGNLFPWIIASDLSAGDKIVNQPLSPTINATISKTYAGATRPVNVFNFTYSLAGISSRLTYFWDKTTGVLLEQFYDITGANLIDGLSDVKASSTNIWNPEQPDFQISSTPDSLALRKGSAVTSTITIKTLNGFNGTITLSRVSSLGLSASMDRGSVSLEADETVTATLTVSSGVSLSPGSYSVNVTGSIYSLSHVIIIPVTVTEPPDFTISFNAATIAVQAGFTANSPVTIAPQNGFTGTVQLLPASSSSGLSASLEKQSVSLDNGQPESSTLTISVASETSPGSYNVNVTGSTSSLSHRISISVTVTPAPNFALNIASMGLSVEAGSSTTTTITITPQYGLTGSISLTASAPSGLLVALGPTSLDGSGTSKVTITTDATLAAGSYDVVVTATKGTVAHSETITVTVKPAPVLRAPSVFGLDPTIFYSSLVAIAVGTLAIVVFLRRRASPVSSTTRTPSGP